MRAPDRRSNRGEWLYNQLLNTLVSAATERLVASRSLSLQLAAYILAQGVNFYLLCLVPIRKTISPHHRAYTEGVRNWIPSL